MLEVTKLSIKSSETDSRVMLFKSVNISKTDSISIIRILRERERERERERAIESVCEKSVNLNRLIWLSNREDFIERC